MAFRLDPRSDQLPSNIRPRTHTHSRTATLINSIHHSKRISSLSLAPRTRPKPCYDWIFSSATNVHIALDRYAFKEYTPFDSYVLALSDYRQIHVQGIGTVEVKIRCRPNSKESHTVVLENVLHIPTWLCNIFSDVYFGSGHDFEHAWGEFGVQLSRREDNELRPWGYTESFCSLDRLVLSKRHKDSRSPMLEDRDREVFSINVTWPLSQRDRWDAFLAQDNSQQPSRATSEFSTPMIKSPHKDVPGGGPGQTISAGNVSRRATLSNISANIAMGIPGKRGSSLRATTSGKDLKKPVY